MNKRSKETKQLLINILNAINPYWNLAEGFLTIIQNTNNDNLIKYLLIEIQNGIKSIKSKRNKEEIQKKIKKLREENHKKEQQEKKEADEFLETFINSI